MEKIATYYSEGSFWIYIYIYIFPFWPACSAIGMFALLREGGLIVKI